MIEIKGLNWFIFCLKEQFFRVNDTNYSGNNLMDSFRCETVDDCENACGLNDLCFTYSYKNKLCWLKFRYIYTHTAIRETLVESGYPVIGNNSYISI